MATFDILIKNGTIIDGSRAPRYRADLGIVDGRIARIGHLDSADAERTLDATDCIVAPGFIDLHTHYDAQIFWDPYCTISGWHGVTSVVIGNCGFGFAPVAPEQRERAMLSMTRVEAIPLDAMRAGMPWDWVTYPEFLASVDRTPKGVNLLPYVPAGPLLSWVLGLEDAKAGREPTPDEMAAIKRLLHEAMDAGGCGWSAQRLPAAGGMANQRDFDGTAMPTDNMSNATAVALATVLRERNEGFIQMTLSSGDPKADGAHFQELAEVSGRPILFNSLKSSDGHPQRHRNLIKFFEDCRKKGLRVYAQSTSAANGFTFSFVDWNLFDDSEAWMEATTGTFEDRLRKLADPARRQALKDNPPGDRLVGSIEEIVVMEVTNPELEKYQALFLGEIAASEGRNVIDVMLDISVKDELKTVFYAEGGSRDFELLSEVVRYPWSLMGISDGGAHTKFSTGGRYPTECLIRFCRDNQVVELEEMHWRMSAFPAFAAGFSGRGMLREGAPADINVYNLDELEIAPMEVAHDFPGGEWRRIQAAKGYRYTLVNGEVTFVDGIATGATPGMLLRHGGRLPDATGELVGVAAGGAN